MNERFAFNERGFLLLEHLIAIAIMSILSLAFFALMQMVSSYTVDQEAFTMHEANTLAVRMQNEIKTADFLSTANGQLLAHFDDGTVSFAILNNRLTRQVNGRGGEILAYNVHAMDVTLFDQLSARITLRTADERWFQLYLSVLNIQLDFPEIEEPSTESQDEKENENEDSEE